MLKDAVKWLGVVNMVTTFAAPLIKSYLTQDDEKLPDWFDDLSDLIASANANAKAGVAFDEALAARIEQRLAALPAEPSSEDFLSMGRQIRTSYLDFKDIMAARRAGLA